MQDTCISVDTVDKDWPTQATLKSDDITDLARPTHSSLLID